ncbi:steroid 17-alpha-hydroxylase/17,20 lyase-like [Babylonia areolata]|uniref:steroid 17-alpha-hydroxylase/17,20 lyase-like n=1 Tax=Babylonia areolata TaxID=304850 RepID=UPI003FD39950
MAVVLVLSCIVLILITIFILRSRLLKRTTTDNGEPIPSVEPCLPFFGNALHINTANFHLILSELRQTYGPVFYIRLFQEKILVLNDYASIHDALVVKGSDFGGRPCMYRTSQADRNKHSIVWQTYTKRLMFLRKLVLRCLKMYGTGLEKLEERCALDIQHVCDRFRQTGGRPFDPLDSIYESVCSIMLYLTLGTRFDHGSPVFQSIREMNELFNDTFGSGKCKQLDVVPLLRLLRADSYCQMQRALQLRDDFWHEQLNKMKTDGEDPGCIVQTLLDQMDMGDHTHSASVSSSSSSSPSSPVNMNGYHRHQPSWGHSNLALNTAKEVFTNLILAGTDTTTTSLSCFLLILLHHPDIQHRLQQDVDRVVGRSRPPSLADKAHLPYVEAVLMELLRYISHVPLAVPHYTMCDTSVLGRPVPANTTVYINLWSLHHDKTEWTDPWRFDPSRFLDDGDQLVTPSHENRRKLLPFGAGRRVCLGEVLAKNRLFLFVTSLVQQFHFEAEDGDSLPDVDPRTYEMGLVVHPKPFRVRAVPRGCSDGAL